VSQEGCHPELPRPGPISKQTIFSVPEQCNVIFYITLLGSLLTFFHQGKAYFASLDIKTNKNHEANISNKERNQKSV